MIFTRIEHEGEWDPILLGLPGPHLLQSWAWGELKAKYGWHAERWVWHAESGTPIGAAQVLFRSVRGGLTMAYCPRGPVLDWDQPEVWNPILQDMLERIAANGTFFVKIDPGLRLPLGDESKVDAMDIPSAQALLAAGWLLSKEQVQFRNTLTINLTQDEDALLAGMKQKTRYNIRLAGRRGVTFREGTSKDFELLYNMYAETSIRDGFVIRPPGYYQDAWGNFMARNQAVPLIAEVEGQSVAALMVYHYGQTAYYLYGMSREAHREKMPNHLLQWEAIRWAKAQGCSTYDFWGAPHEIESGASMYGVYRFKLGFGAELVRTPGAWDFAIKPVVYRLYTTLMPLLLAIMRRLGRARTRTQIQDA